MSKIEILDTTLRDGEQTEGVSFRWQEKFTIARYLLEKVNVDYVELTSARISDSDLETVRKITQWAKTRGYLGRIEVLGFVDGGKSVEWIYESGARTMNLLVKGSLNHLKVQLKKSPKEHARDIGEVIALAKHKGMRVNCYLEDWSNGMKDSKEYVFYITRQLQEMGVSRIMLADTLGVLDYEKTYVFVKQMKEGFPGCRFDFHGHNDYEQAVSNSIAAVKAGATTVHTTVNGLGERAGNTKLAPFAAALNDMTGFKLNIKENTLARISNIVEGLSGIRISPNTPITGRNAFTQNCGVHADGDRKGGIYRSSLTPERFGRTKTGYSLGKTSGIASIEENLKALQLSFNLSPEQKKAVLKKIKEIGEKKQKITKEDLPYIILDIIGTPPERKVEMMSYEFVLKKGSRPRAVVRLKIGRDEYLEEGYGSGQYDAFMNALIRIFGLQKKSLPLLVDYQSRIPPGGETSAIVETTITWRNHNNMTYKTRGIDSDQLVAAIEATVKMLNINGF